MTTPDIQAKAKVHLGESHLVFVVDECTRVTAARDDLFTVAFMSTLYPSTEQWEGYSVFYSEQPNSVVYASGACA